MLVALSAQDLNTWYLHIMSVQHNGHLQNTSNTNSHTQATPAGSSCNWWDVTQFPHLAGTGRRLWQEEDHSHLEACTKGINTHDKVGKPLLKPPTPMISCKGWGSIPSESVWSRATTWSGRGPLHHVQQAHQEIIVIHWIWVTNTAFKQCCITVPCALHCSTMAM